MRRYLTGLIALFALAAVTLVNAGNFYTGNDLMGLCKNTGQSESGQSVRKYSKCTGYLAGVVDFDEALPRLRILPSRLCVPEGVTNEQLRQVYLTYMEKHPNEWHWQATDHAYDSFYLAWPCKE